MDLDIGIGEPTWLEKNAIAGFRIWHIIFICFSGLMSVVIMLCCCMRFRIPRTKQDIEADFHRKKLARKFRRQLSRLQNSEMNDLDLSKAMERVRERFKTDYESDVPEESESFSNQTKNNNKEKNSKRSSPDNKKANK